MAVTGKNTLELIIAARDRTRGAFTKVGAQMKGLEKASSKITGAFKKAAKAGVLIGGAAVVGGIVASTKAFIDFEDAMANVRKTTGMTKDEISVLGDAIKELSLRIPVAQTELAGIAAVAGQLGISGKENILSFTEDVAKMTTAFDMNAEEVAIAMAKLSNIYDIPIEQTSNLGSAINVLGNTTAASERQLMAFSMALGPAAQQLGFTATEALSLGASMIGIGMDASNAGTRLSRAFSMIGQNLDEVAGFMGVTVDEFKNSFEAMPMETFISIIEKLSKVEGKLNANTIGAKIFGEIGGKAIKGVMGDLDGLTTNLDKSAKGYKENTSLTEEFAAKTDTLKARFTLLKNSITDVLIDIGAGLAPVLTNIIENIRDIMPAVKEAAMELGAGFSEMFESISRQAGGALEPLIAALEEAGEKMSAGMDFETIADDIGVFIGAGLRPLIEALTWLHEKFGPLWELIGKGATLFHDLANALKTEEGRIDDILDATEKLTEAKQDLFDINEKLRGNVETLSEALSKAGGWTTTLTELEADARIQMSALTVARKLATEAITTYGADSEIAKTAIENVKIAEEAATGATNDFNTAVGIASQAIIDEGVATEGLEQAQLDFTTSTEDVIEGQENLVIAVANAETELEEAKAAPFKLGEAFEDFGKLVARIFLAIPLMIAESILSTQEIISEGLAKIGLGGFGEKLEADTERIKEKIASIKESLVTNIEEPLSEDIPAASEEMEEAITAGLDAINSPAKRVKKGIEDIDTALEDTGDTATDTGKVGEETFKKIEIIVDKVTGNIEVLTDNLGETADSFKDNEAAAKTLLDLDWEVFSKLEADLPNINSGIENMASAFTGLEVILSQNFENLQNVKEAVEGISRITTPFADKGFLNGIKSIGTFANTLKDAGSAINTFANLQDISIDGCINFSLHVNDMVSALRILENQMEDLVPAFADMDSLITDIVDAFLYSGGKVDTFISDFNNQMDSAYSTMKKAGVPFGDFKNLVDGAFDTGSFEYWRENLFWNTQKVDNLTDAIRWMDMAITSSNDSIGEFKTKAEAWEDIDFRYAFEQQVAFPLQEWIRTNYGVTVSMKEMYELMSKPPEEQKIWLDKLMHSEEALTFQMDKQINALKTQNEQLAKITTALEPYLNFMRTLNELAALSTISTDELNNGLNAIKDTITNLGSALADFDLRSVMESLFGDKGTTEGFMTTMKDYESKFGTLIAYIDRMAISMTTLVDAFESFSKISESILKDKDALRIVFQDIVDIMTNFNLVMSEGFGDKIVIGFEKMLTSAQPLILYFRDNNMAVSEFNTTLTTFKTTLSNVASVMESLKKISEMTAPSVDELSAGFDAASRMVRDFNNALMEHVGAREGQWDMEKYFSSVFVSIKTFAKDWEMLTSNMDKSFETFNTASSTITDMINNVLSLSTAFTTLGNSTIASAKDMERAMQNINVFVIRFTDALRLNLDALVDALIDLDIEWSIHAKAMEDVMPSYKSATGDVTTLIGSLTSLGSAMESLAEMGTISSKKFDQGFGSLIENIKNFSVSLKTNVVPMITALESLRKVWMKNEAVLVPLMQDFVIITKNFASMATNANIMINAFERLAENSGSLEAGFKTLIEFIKDVVENTKEFYTPETANEIAAFVEDIEKVIDSFADLDSKIESAVREIENKVTDAVREIEDTILGLSNLNEKMFNSGKNLMQSFINGLKSLRGELEESLEDIATIIADYLAVESPTRLGPLQDLEKWPRNLVKSFSEGIHAEMGSINKSFVGMAAPIAPPGGAGGGNTSVVFHVTQNIKDQPTADYATNELKKMLNKHEVL